MAIGLDKGEDNLLKLSLQFSAPKSGDTGSGSQQFTNTLVTTAQCNSFDSGINLINSYISKQVNLSHAKVIVFSEELASSGISKYISTLMNNIEIRPDCNIVICKTTAEDFLNNSSSNLETLSARYYEQVIDSSENTGFTSAITLNSFYSAYKSSTSQPIGILGNIKTANLSKTSEDESYADADSNYIAGQMPIRSKTNIEFVGLAVFNEDKLVGELNGINSVCHLLCTNEFKNSTISIPSPFNQGEIMDIFIQSDKSNNIDVSILNGSPYINLTVYLLSYVDSMEYGLDLTSSENVSLIEEYASSYLKSKLLDYLYSTSKEFHADIADFGKYSAVNYLTVADWEKLDWKRIYSDSFFNVDVKIKVKNGNLLVRN